MQITTAPSAQNSLINKPQPHNNLVTKSNQPMVSLDTSQSSALRNQVLFGQIERPRLDVNLAQVIDGGFAGKLHIYELVNPKKPDAPPQRVLILPQSAARTSQLGTLFKVGSNAENDLSDGYAHFLEHNAFKGTADEEGTLIYGPGGYDQVMEEELRIDVNANTGEDRTLYIAVNIPEQFTKKAIDAHAPFAQGFSLPSEGIRGEQGTVIEEIRLYGDQFMARTFMSIQRDAFGNHPNNRNILGPELNIAEATHDSVKKFYLDNYGPGNRSVIVVTPTDNPDEMARYIADRYNMNLDGFSPDALEVETFQPRPDGLIRKEMVLGDLPASDGLIFHMAVGPDARNMKDMIVWDLISHMIGGENSIASIGNLELIESRKLVHSMSTGAQDIIGGSPLYTYATVDSAKIDEAENALKSIYEQLKTGNFSDDDLDLAKAGLELGYVQGISRGRAGMLSTIAHYEKAGVIDQVFGEQYLKMLANISKNDVVRIANTYMTPGRSVEYNIVGTDDKSNEVNLLNPGGERYQHIVDVDSIGSDQLKTTLKSAKTSSSVKFSGQLRSTDITHTTDNGVEIIHRTPPADRILTSVAVTLPKGQASAAELEVLSHLIGKQTQDKSVADMSRHMVRQRVEVKSMRNSNGLILTVEGPTLGVENGVMSTGDTDRFDAITNVLKEVLSESVFSDEDIDTVRQLIEREYRDMLGTKTKEEALMRHYEILYPEGHQYGDSLLSRRIKDLQNVTKESLKERLQELANGPKTVAVTGHVPSNHVFDSVSNALLTLNAEDTDTATKIQAPTYHPEKSVLIAHSRLNENAETSQHAQIFRTWQTPGAKNDKETNLKLGLLQLILSGGLNSRLFQTFREKQTKGLCYSVKGELVAKANEGRFHVYVGGSHQNTPKLLSLFDEEMQRLIDEPVSETELNFAKGKFRDKDITADDITMNSSILTSNHRHFNIPSTEDYLALLDGITAEDLQQTALEVFNQPSVTTTLTTEEYANEVGLPLNKPVDYDAWQNSLEQPTESQIEHPNLSEPIPPPVKILPAVIPAGKATDVQSSSWLDYLPNSVADFIRRFLS